MTTYEVWSRPGVTRYDEPAHEWVLLETYPTQDGADRMVALMWDRYYIDAKVEEVDSE